MESYIVHSGFFGEASIMREPRRNYRGGSLPEGAREQHFCRVQNGYEIHQIIAITPPRTTALLYFVCSLQADECRLGQDLASIDRRRIEPGGFVAERTPVPMRLGLPQRRVFLARARGGGGLRPPARYRSPPQSHIKDARRSLSSGG